MTSEEWTKLFMEIKTEVEKISEVSQKEGIVISLIAYPDGYVNLYTHEDKHEVISFENGNFKIRNGFETYDVIPRGVIEKCPGTDQSNQDTQINIQGDCNTGKGDSQ